MTPLGVILNILWLILGGFWAAVAWFLGGVIMAITIIGLPWASVGFKFASYTLFPFGRHAVRRTELSGDPVDAPGVFSLLRNLLWLVLVGWWLALLHLFWAVLNAVTVIGVPFAWAHLKMAALAIWPAGKIIVTEEGYELARSRMLHRHPLSRDR